MSQGADGDQDLSVRTKDRLLIDVRSLFRENPEAVSSAGKRMRATIRRLISAEKEKAREEAVETRALLQVARQIVLDRMDGRDNWNEPSDLATDPPPPDFAVSHLPNYLARGPAPRWAQAIYESLGKFDHSLERKLRNLEGWLESAHSGTFGEWIADGRIDLRKTGAIKAYSHSQTVPLTHPETGRWDRARNSWFAMRTLKNPKAPVAFAATSWWALYRAIDELLCRPEGDILSRDEWWDIAFLFSLIVDPDFNAAESGCNNAPPWYSKKLPAKNSDGAIWQDESAESGEPAFGGRRAVRTQQRTMAWTGRRTVLKDFGSGQSTNETTTAEVWAWARRARDFLRHDSSTRTRKRLPSAVAVPPRRPSVRRAPARRVRAAVFKKPAKRQPVVWITSADAAERSGLSTEGIRAKAKLRKWPTNREGRMWCYRRGDLLGEWPTKNFDPRSEESRPAPAKSGPAPANASKPPPS